MLFTYPSGGRKGEIMVNIFGQECRIAQSPRGAMGGKFGTMDRFVGLTRRNSNIRWHEQEYLNPQVISLQLSIIHYPHPTLRHVSKPLKRVDAQLRSMVQQMFELMYEYQGVGLAANQVDLPYRLFVANPTGDPKVTDAEYTFINPVLSGGKGQVEGEEGCLSIPGVNGQVVRKEKITIEAYSLTGEQISADLDDLFARIVQHETDHLDGTLFVDRLTLAQNAEVRSLLEEFEIDFQSKRERGELPSDEVIASRLEELEKLRT